MYSCIKNLTIGTKADDVINRQVPSVLGKSWCRENGNIPFFEVSIKDLSTVERLFEVIAKVASGQPKEVIQNFTLQKPPQQRQQQAREQAKKDKCEC